MPRSGWTTRCNLLTRRIGWPVYPFPDGRAEGRTPRGKPRGLLYDREMLRYSGERFRVLRRVEEIVDEHGGTMLRMPKGTLIPDGEACLGDVEERQIFSLRAIDSFQLETWLMRMDGRSDECRA